MNEYRNVEEKLASGITALASGLLTTLVCDSIKGAEYSVNIVDKEYTVPWIRVEWGQILFVITVFFFLWALISVGIPKLLKLKRRFTYAKIQPVREKDRLKTLDSVNKATVQLVNVFCNDEKVKDPDVLILYVRDLATTVLQLHRSFLPYNRKLQKRVRNSFRAKTHAPIQSIGKKATDYEFSAIVALLRKCVKEAEKLTGYDPLLHQDCNALYAYLDELDGLLHDTDM